LCAFSPKRIKGGTWYLNLAALVSIFYARSKTQSQKVLYTIAVSVVC